MVNNICKKTDFKAFYKNDIKNAYEVRFGYEPIIESGNETIFCQYAVEFFYHKPSGLDIDKCFERSSKNPSMEEVKTILEGIGLTSNEMIPLLKEYLLKKIAAYDGSSEVNQFFIGGFPTWLDKATRVGLKLRFEAELAQGMQQTTLWQDGISFPLPLVGDGNAFDMLNAIELYASACYDNTQKHIAAVRELSTVEELVSYDFRSGYPQKLEFGK